MIFRHAGNHHHDADQEDARSGREDDATERDHADDEIHDA